MQPAGLPAPTAPGSGPGEESEGGEEPAARFAWLRSPARRRDVAARWVGRRLLCGGEVRPVPRAWRL